MRILCPFVLSIVLTAPAWADAIDAYSADDLAAIRGTLAGAQQTSIRRNREICGLFARRDDGLIVTTRGRVGRRDACRPPNDPRGLTVIATWHTHAAFEEDYDSEVPSPMDVEGDLSEGVDGFVATPGGRLWIVDGVTGISTQVCGPGCLPSDPDFVPGVFGDIADSYTLDQLYDRADH